MSEMLANQYFLTRKYCEAQAELESTLSKYPANKSIKKKLIICYVVNKDLRKAFDLFSELVNEDADFIINTDTILDDCPCPEIIYEIENTAVYANEEEKTIALGILWLYCDVNYSISHLKLTGYKDERINQIIKLLSTKTKITQR